ILTDWGLAKVDSSEMSQQKPRQPERTGTWQFMSVTYTQDHPHRPAAVPDGLESFFHVLIFYAARFLPNNIRGVRAFITDYFDSYKPHTGGRRARSSLREATMQFGMTEGVTIAFIDKDGRVNVPLNKIIDQRPNPDAFQRAIRRSVI
ncbi:hypothetical protein C8Q77DRAFT_1252906, partial [Trametes polyzona]